MFLNEQNLRFIPNSKIEMQSKQFLGTLYRRKVRTVGSGRAHHTHAFSEVRAKCRDRKTNWVRTRRVVCAVYVCVIYVEVRLDFFRVSLKYWIFGLDFMVQ